MMRRLPRSFMLLPVMLLCLLCVTQSVAQLADGYRVAVPGYHYEFPRDHFNHPEFRTEWWYFTGNLRSRDGRRFGFELTFFRQAVARDAKPSSRRAPSERHIPTQRVMSGGADPNSGGSDWQVHDIYLAHLALSDIDGRQYLHTSRLNRAGPGLAGADLAQSRIWNGNWEARWRGDRQDLRAVAERFTLDLTLKSLKPPVINGLNGVSQKAPGLGRASYYISLTRLGSEGTLTLDGKRYEVSGLAWMDHEFFTHQLEQSQVGWDWLSLQLDDGSEIMLYRLRRKDSKLDPFSAGTYVDPEGHSHHLSATDFSLESGQVSWTSPDTRATYPVQWRVRVASPSAVLDISTLLENQEFSSESRAAPSYWEGAIQVEGNKNSIRARGVGYLEMTGYDRPVDLSQ